MHETSSIGPRPLSRWDGIAAGSLVLLTASLLLGSMNVGFPRDEGFYFRFGALYQEWIDGVWHGDWSPGDRERTDAVWRNNREHPPLAKVLFGLSWAGTAEKKRPVQRVEKSRNPDESDWIHVTGLRGGEGFREGVRLAILKPRMQSDEASEERVIGHAEVDAVREGRIRARLMDGPLQHKSFREICGGRQGPEGALSGCEAVVETDLGKWNESTGFRFPTVLFCSLLVGSLYWFGARWIGRWGGGFAALSFLFAPRHFYHAHLATFDVPVVAMIFWLVVAFWMSTRDRRWAPWTGILFGLALLTKLNAFFVPVVLGGWWLSHGLVWRPGRFPGVSPRAVPPFPSAFLWMIVLGVPLFWGFWPRLWHDSWPRFLEYVRFHLHHEHYMQNYFGQILSYPPFPVLFPFVMSMVTLPLVTLGMGIGGAGLSLREGLRNGWEQRKPFSLGEMLGIHALFPFVLIAMPSTPVFGGVKHWMTAMPFFCLLGGMAVEHLFQRMAEKRWGNVPGLRAGFLFLMLLPGILATFRVHPNGTAYYNSLMGGVAGAADASMQRQFWGGQTLHALPVLNERVPRGGKVYFHKSSRGCWDLYRKDGLLRMDIRHFGDYHNFNDIEEKLRETTHAVYHHQKSHDDYELAIWRAYGTELPIYQYSLEGVPLVSVYENPDPPNERKQREAERKALKSRTPKRPGKGQPVKRRPQSGGKPGFNN